MFKIFTKKGKVSSKRKGLFSKIKRGTKLPEERFEKQDKEYDFNCPKCKIKFNSDIYRMTVTITSRLNVITKHTCGTRCHRLIKDDPIKIEELMMKSWKTPVYRPTHLKIIEKYKQR
jgi:Zn finger protein HypA/HybF involved in hydrogenase expression